MRPYHLLTPEQEQEQRKLGRSHFLQESAGQFENEEEAERWADYAVSRQGQVSFQPRATETLQGAAIQGLPVIVADEVGAFAPSFLGRSRYRTS